MLIGTGKLTLALSKGDASLQGWVGSLSEVKVTSYGNLFLHKLVTSLNNLVTDSTTFIKVNFCVLITSKGISVQLVHEIKCTGGHAFTLVALHTS